jgi:uncharacterized C2H2 Zn-finger protein
MKRIRVTKLGRAVRKWIPRMQPIEVDPLIETEALPPPIEVDPLIETEALPPPIEVDPLNQLRETASVPLPITDGRLLFPRAKPKICDKCDESYPSISKFNAHRATCKKHKCSHPSGCDLRFTTGQELKEHARSHRIRFQCDECETEPFHSQGALEYHKKAVHGSVIKCPHCDATFCRPDVRDDHVKNKHNAETVNKCACGATYVKKCQLERHEEQCIVSPMGAANAVKRKYAELVQDKMEEEDDWIDAAALSTEAVAIVREEAQKKVKCETCGAPYGNRESLERHIRKKHPRASGSGNESPENALDD